jgi:hypothetical protein
MGWLDTLVRRPIPRDKEGLGVERDAVAAFSLLLRARRGGSPLAGQFFTAVRASLSPDQHVEAERRAASPPEPAI